MKNSDLLLLAKALTTTIPISLSVEESIQLRGILGPQADELPNINLSDADYDYPKAVIDLANAPDLSADP